MTSQNLEVTEPSLSPGQSGSLYSLRWQTCTEPTVKQKRLQGSCKTQWQSFKVRITRTKAYIFSLLYSFVFLQSGSPEEIRLAVANSDLALDRGEIDSALDILKTIGPEQAYYIQAKEKMAEIYLKHRKDKRMYAQCYRQIVEKSGSAHSYVLLGDAYMAIQEPERALEIYEQAVKRNPRDPHLAAKMGQACTAV